MNRIDDIIHFNVPPNIEKSFDYIKDAVLLHKISGDGKYTRLCCKWLEEQFNVKKVLLTTSGSAALDMAALLCGIKPGDEVIMPSYTFSSTANAFVLRGAKIVFVDIRPDTMNINEKLIEQAISSRTRAIVPVHYAGVSCEMDTILDIAKRYNLFVVEDAAQAITSTYKGRFCGTIGDFGCFSFHETKNFSMGEGGAIFINNQEFASKAEIYREKGTNRSAFFRGEIDKYTWVDYGDSFLQSELNAAYLWAQFEEAYNIQNNRFQTWNDYWNAFNLYVEKWNIDLPTIPENCTHNAHMFYIKCEDLERRDDFIHYMKNNGIYCVFHYIPLHSAPAGIMYGRFVGDDIYTTSESNRLVRLPLYYDIFPEDKETVIQKVYEYFENEIR